MREELVTNSGKGWLLLVIGLLLISFDGSFDRLEIVFGYSDFVSGFCTGLAIVILAAAIFVLARSTQTPD